MLYCEKEYAHVSHLTSCVTILSPIPISISHSAPNLHTFPLHTGIGFFLGGIGPDGHIAFNQQGDKLDSTTRLVNFNYPSAAQAAGDLGGIEISRGKAAITIGLKVRGFDVVVML